MKHWTEYPIDEWLWCICCCLMIIAVVVTAIEIRNDVCTSDEPAWATAMRSAAWVDPDTAQAVPILGWIDPDTTKEEK
jgi:hypothetical protein